jgi:surface antigen
MLSAPFCSGSARAGRVLLLALFAMLSLSAAPQRASAYAVDCQSGSISCISNTGYSGGSVWGYPVDGAGNNCTNYAAFRLAQNGAGNPGNLGNAGDWANSARAKGFAVDGNPALGSIAQWNYGSAYAPSFGHVAYVEGWDGATLTLSDSNWQGGSRRWRVSPGERFWPNNFLHIKDAGALPTGAYDLATSPTHGQVRVAGWSFDRDNLPQSIDMHVYVGGPAGTPGAEGHAFTANGSRPDVDAVHHVGAAHGLDVTFDSGKRGAQQVCLYAINIGPGANVGLGCKTVTIGDPNPLGAYDNATSPAGGKVRVDGWGFDPNDPRRAIDMHIYVGGPAGTPGAEGHAFTANATRPDVDAVHHTGSDHGLSIAFDTDKRGAQQVCLYAINVGPGGNIGLGCKAVTIGAPPAATPKPTPAPTPKPTPAPTTAPTTSSTPLTSTSTPSNQQQVLGTRAASRTVTVTFSRAIPKSAKLAIKGVKGATVTSARRLSSRRYRVVLRFDAALPTKKVKIVAIRGKRTVGVAKVRAS